MLRWLKSSMVMNLPLHECEPAGHGIGRSRDGLTTKIHTAVDGNGRPLAVVVTGGQRNDGAMLAAALDEIAARKRRGTGCSTNPLSITGLTADSRHDEQVSRFTAAMSSMSRVRSVTHLLICEPLSAIVNPSQHPAVHSSRNKLCHSVC
jgi:hypothetical protein